MRKNERISKYNEIYWTTHFLFFLIIIVIFVTRYIDDDKYAEGQVNAFWIIACTFFLIVNTLYLKAIKEKAQTNQRTKYQLLYSLMLIVFTIVFSCYLHLDLHAMQFIYLFFIILVSLTCAIELGLGIAILLGIVNVLTNNIALQYIWLIFSFYLLMAWLIGKVSQINLKYAQQVEQEKKFLADIIETLTTGIVITNAEGKITLCNSETEKMLQLNNSDIIGKSEKAIIKVLNLPNGSWLQEGFNNREVVINGRNYLISRFHLQKEQPYTITVINDITELTEQKKQIENLKIFSAMGELAAGVAHEVRNPLTTIRGFMQLTENNLKDTQYYPMSKMVVEELDRINWIVDGLMQMTPQKAVEYKLLNLNDVINKVWELYTYDGQSKGINYNKDLFEPLPPICGSQKQIQQIILNLLQNAEKACQEGDNITIETYINNKQEVCFDVIDNGKGIAPDQLDKVTIPLYTGDLSGTGFGLPICSRIISEHKGFLDIISEPCVGTIVTVRFPPANESTNNPSDRCG